MSKAIITFAIDFDKIKTFTNKGVIELNSDVLTVQNAKKEKLNYPYTFEVEPTADYVTYEIECQHTNKSNNYQAISIYLPDVGHFSYRSGNWIVGSVEFPGAGQVAGQKARSGDGTITTQLNLSKDKQIGNSVDFRLHLQIQWHDEDDGSLKVVSCFIDPILQVKHSGG